jgi:hypothetical protein
MNGINNGRVIGGGLVAGVVIAIGEWLRDGVLPRPGLPVGD